MSRAYTEAMARLAFMQKVRIDEETGCWEWQGAKDRNGYGVVMWQGKLRRAHRQSYEWENGELPKEIYACHQCDNRGCVNPDHIQPGSPSDNLKEAHDRGRHPRRSRKGSGEQSGTNVLTEAQVLEIRRQRREGRAYPSLAEEYGVSEATARYVAEGKRWAHLPGAIQPEERASLTWRGKLVRGENNVNCKLTWEKVREIRRRAEAGELPSHFHAEYGIALSTACDIIKRKIWRED